MHVSDSYEDELTAQNNGNNFVIAGTVTGNIILNVMMEDCGISRKNIRNIFIEKFLTLKLS